MTNARQTINPFNDIRSEDIERVEVVKGAAATTLYGTEASGGVIQIFTKRGRAGKPQWSLDLTGGTNDLDYLKVDGDPTAVYLKDCQGPELFGLDIVPTSATFGQDVKFEDATCPSRGKWIRTGAVQKAAMSVAGGSDIAQYFLAGNLSNEEGALESNEYTTGGFRGNFAFRPFQKLELSLNSSYQRGDQDWIADGNLANGFLLNVARGTAGNYRGAGCVQTGVICMNNDAALTIGTKTKTDHYISGFTMNYSPIEAWTNRLSVGFDYNNVENRSVIPFGHLRNAVGQLTQANWVRQFLSVDYASTYKKDFRGSITTSTSVGGQLFQDNLSSTAVTADEFSGPGDPVITSAARRTVGTDTRRRVVNAGLFFQEQIGWNDRAFLTLGMRVDGNSAFGKDFGLQWYPKVGFAYALSDHEWWPKNTIETFKLRTAIGESGKAPGAFDAVRTWDPIAGDEAKPGFSPNQLGNPNLGPERTREAEFGLEASAFAGRFSVDMTYFNTTTSDALIQVRYPPSQGFLNRQLENIGEVQNSGLEVKFDAGLVRRSNFDWRGRVNFTHLKSEATDLGDEPLIAVGGSFTEVRVGYPVTSLFARKILNADKFEAPVRSDTNMYIGPTWPTNIMGFGTTLTLFDKLTIDGLGEFQKGGYNINYVGLPERDSWQLASVLRQPARHHRRGQGRCQRLERHQRPRPHALRLQHDAEPRRCLDPEARLLPPALRDAVVSRAGQVDSRVARRHAQPRRAQPLPEHRLQRPRPRVVGPGRQPGGAARVLRAAAAALVLALLPDQLVTPTEDHTRCSGIESCDAPRRPSQSPPWRPPPAATSSTFPTPDPSPTTT
ncbi:MAG: TonB-dependent receptor [Gemmatimonadetes bacterium]|nr:TonB-dependent receptor [Gemmatimonadota bacterium]